ncbi:Tn3 family transposase [Candidatus Paracaedibacter symbiosus]|uniref:Tn3 family transposase n=1 Tax=Candidatus Paracaedibacter symbiosus TaxID=244582 RepID=UPI0005093CF4|nr:Tn3 family transposase [Candidatus Paracaedibacter symbiosus]
MLKSPIKEKPSKVGSAKASHLWCQKSELRENWNYLYLSDKLERIEDQPKQQKALITAISTHSVMSWAHVNMLGEYDFSDEKLSDSFNICPQKLRA